MTDRRAKGANWRWLLKALFVILWAFFIVAAYFWAHKPFDGAVLSGVGRTVASITLWLFVTAIGAALGRWLMDHLSHGAQMVADEAPFLRVALTAGTGLGLISLLMMFLALAGLFRAWAAAVLLVVLALLVRKQLVATYRDVRRLAWPGPRTGLQRWFLFYGIASLFLTFLVSLAPPTAWDTLVYHLTGPRLYAQAGRAVHPLDLPYLGFPQLGQMQFGLGLLLVGDTVAALFHFGYGLLALAVTVALARRAFGADAAWFAGALLLSVPTLFSLMSQPYVDVTLLFYATAAFYAFLRWREHYAEGKSGTGWLLLLGLLCGFSGGVKYTAVAIPIAIAASIAWVSWRDGLLALIRRLVLVAAVALAAVAPWLLENWLTTGNPVYPFFFDNALYWDAWRGWWYDRPGTGLATTAPWRLLLVPFEASILGTEGTEFYEATLGPLLMLAGGLLLVIWHKLEREEKSISGHMLLFFAVNYLLWLNGVARTALLLRSRFLFLVFGVVSALGGLALSRLPALRRPQLDVPWLVNTVVAITLALTLFAQFTNFLALNPLPVTAGIESRKHFLERRLGSYYTAIETVNQLPPEARVVFLWEPRSYACNVECWPDALLDRLLHHTHYYGQDAAEIAASWREEGFTHVLLHQAGLDFVAEAGFDPVTAADLETMERLKSDHLRLLRGWQDDYFLYELTAGESPVEVLLP